MEYWITGITACVAFWAMAWTGYVIGRSQRSKQTDQLTDAQKIHQVMDLQNTSNTQSMARQLEKISSQLRQQLAAHHSKFNRCLTRLQTITDRCDGPHDTQLRADLLLPADELTHEIATAYHQLRQHSESLTRLHAGCKVSGPTAAKPAATDDPSEASPFA